MTVSVDMGLDERGQPVAMDLEELLATRLLVQGNSGSGKSHLLRRLLERSAGQVQQVVIDPEGDFVTLGPAYGHVVIEASGYSLPEIARFAARLREHRASVVLSLEGLDAEDQMRCAAAFLSALFDAPREHWYPALVVVDEAQLFAPTAGGEVTEEVRRASLSAMTNLMCRGRKRGLAGVIATQRLAKLAKNVAAEASNFLMGRTFLDIDMARAADLLGMERRQADAIRDLPRGAFMALGPAVSRRPLTVRIGAVETSARSGSPRLVPLPEPKVFDLADMLAGPADDAPLLPMTFEARPRRVPADELAAELTRDRSADRVRSVPDAAVFGSSAVAPPPPDEAEAERIVADTLRAVVEDAEAALRPAAVLFQDFQVRCRMAGLARPPLDLAVFARRLACARAGIFDVGAEEWREALALAGTLPDDMMGAFLLIARAARDGRPCPSDQDLATTYGTSSLGRVRRLIGYIESRDLFVTRVDLAGKRSITIPRLGWTTEPAEAA